MFDGLDDRADIEAESLLLIVLGLVVGGVFYWRSQQGPDDPLS